MNSGLSNVKRILLPYYRFLFVRRGLPNTKFVIIAQGRSGSTLLANLLNNHPSIFCDGEIFMRRTYGQILFPYFHIVNHSKSAYIRGKSAYGFELKIYQFFIDQRICCYKELIHKLNKEGWKFIHLRRLNVLKQCLSSQVYAAYGFSSTRDSNRLKGIRINVDCDRLLKSMRFRMWCNKLEDKALKDCPHMSITYEEDLLDNDRHQETADNTFEYLGIPTVSVKASLKKIASDHLADNIINYDEFREIVRDSEFGDLAEQWGIRGSQV